MHPCCGVGRLALAFAPPACGVAALSALALTASAPRLAIIAVGYGVIGLGAAVLGRRFRFALLSATFNWSSTLALAVLGMLTFGFGLLPSLVLNSAWFRQEWKRGRATPEALVLASCLGISAGMAGGLMAIRL